MKSLAAYKWEGDIMPKMVCVGCQTELIIHKTGAVCVDYFNDPPEPYKLWNCDLWECPKCHKIIAAGFALDPFMECYQGGMHEYIQALSDNPKTVIHCYEFPPITDGG